MIKGGFYVKGDKNYETLVCKLSMYRRVRGEIKTTEEITPENKFI
jgi:hypothetical protein